VLTARELGRVVEGRTLFEGIDFDLSAGLLWIRGPSGTGKSELLRRVAGLVPGVGTLTLEGEAAEAMGLPTWRSRVSLVPQQAPRWEGTGLEAVARVESLAAQRGRASDDPVALAERWGLPPERWKQPMARLSGGEAQRLWMALVLSRRPEVVLLDEPTSALDADATARVESDLKGLTGLLVTHDEAQGERLSSASLVLR
jgi:putative ABC transport system ATP-binding protein